MTFLRDLVDGLARELAEAGVATYRPTGVYASTETAITDTAMPDQPDRAVVLTAYDSADDPDLTDCTVFVQVRTRAGQDPRDVADLDEAAFRVLHGLRDRRYGTARVGLMKRDNSASMGRDSAGRFERTSNYTLRGQRPQSDRLK
ncbi:minor capsid protein [Streptomyces sp. NBC_00124]|uniref:minor capsid protein n=1 Tax=Streptomyces sp. NBC_00124 TaxID=2975662 RepID=UPI002252E034|nr:minor capsid protein [Streptomyces sp. NBC_00124]MCX5362877.1 minor capsid protein [Streptomyces sp. NBC_00124]